MLPALDFEDIPFLLDPASRSPQLEGQHRDKYFEDRLRPLKETGDGAQTAIVVEPTLLQSPSSIPVSWKNTPDRQSSTDLGAQPDSAGISNVDGSPIEAAVYKELSKFVRQEGNSANCWRCQVLGCYKVFMTKHYWEKHVRERHMQWLNKLIDEVSEPLRKINRVSLLKIAPSFCRGCSVSIHVTVTCPELQPAVMVPPSSLTSGR